MLTETMGFLAHGASAYVEMSGNCDVLSRAHQHMTEQLVSIRCPHSALGYVIIVA